MIYYIYMSPDIISEAHENGTYAVQVLIGILRGFISNCCVAEISDWRIQDAIRENVDSWPPNYDRKMLKSVLGVLGKRNRFILCLSPPENSIRGEITAAMAQATNAELDILLVAETQKDTAATSGVESATLSTYNGTGFEQKRLKMATDGVTYKGGEYDVAEFLKKHFHKFLKFATRIEILDAIMGRKFSDNYEYTIRRIFNLLENISDEPSRCMIIFHGEKPEGKRGDYIKTKLSEFKRGRLAEAPAVIEMRMYAPQALPHARFFVTDQFALKIDRGMDFLDKNTGKNRDVTINFANPDEVNSILQVCTKESSGVTKI